jgi:Zn-finger nucleic acid-binding protein
MYCPKCQNDMETGVLDGLRIDRCTSCFGIWFQEDGHKALRKAKGSEQIDTGSAELGRLYDDAVDVPCPECGFAMDHRADPGQSHIRYEACPQGHGVFFDAGEYRDYKEKTLGDLFRRRASI